MNAKVEDVRTPFPSRLLQIGRRLSWRETFAALRYPNYRLWFRGQLVSLFGSWMQATAQGFLIFELTRSPAWLGYAGFAAGLPTWLFMLYAGVVADRVPRRKLLMITQTAMMAPALAMAALIFLNLVRPWHIIVMAFAMGTANAFDAPARQSFVLDMVEPRDLTNAIALNSAMFNTATAIGPAAAGLVYALLGPAWCFLINGLSFLAVIGALAAMRLPPDRRPENRASALAEVREGLAFAAGRPVIRTIIVLVAVMSVFGLSFVTLLPAWAVRVLGGNAATNGLLLSARGIGAFLGALIIASAGGRIRRGRLLTLGTFAFPAFIVAFALSRHLALSLVFLAGSGVALIMVFNLCNALMQTSSPDDLRGRVMSLYTLTFFGLMPLGALWSGLAAARFGSPAAVLTGTLIVLAAAGVIAAASPALRQA